MTSVNPFVSIQVTRPGKGLTTHIANKGFMTSVERPVHLQVTLCAKCFTTHITNKGFMTSVDTLVPRQRTGRGESPTAHLTHMLPGFLCIPFTFPVAIVTSSAVLSGEVWTQRLHFFTVVHGNM